MVLGSSISTIARSQAPQNFETLAIVAPCTSELALGEGEVVLPVGVSRVEFYEALADLKVFAERNKGLVEPALVLERIANSAVSDGKFALPTGVGGIEFSEAFEKFEVLFKRLE